MNILHIESSKNWGGQEYRTVEEVKWLRSHGHDAWIACNPDSETARREPGICLPVRLRASFDPKALAEVKKICSRLRVDVVHTHSPKDSWICAPLQFGLGPAVVRSRQITNPIRPTWSRSFVYRHGCAHVVATSRSIRDALVPRNKVSPQRISVIGEGVNFALFNPEVDGSSFREELNVPHDAVLFGLVAMIRGDKGHDEFIAAAEQLVSENLPVRFAVVGEGTGDRREEMRIRERARDLVACGAMVFTGYRRDVPRIMAGLDVLTLPSVAEAQSLVVPQAFATGRPVIASNVGGIPELVRHEENGLLVPPCDAASLTAAMHRMATDSELRARLGRAALTTARAELSFDDKMGTTVDLYQRIVRSPSRRGRSKRQHKNIFAQVPTLVAMAAALAFSWFGGIQVKTARDGMDGGNISAITSLAWNQPNPSDDDDDVLDIGTSTMSDDDADSVFS